MSSSEVNEALLQSNEDHEVESRNERPGMGIEIRIDARQVICDMKQSMAFEILKSAVAILTSNTKLLLLMMLSVVPLFVFMVFFEIKLQKAVVSAPEFLGERFSEVIMLSVTYNGTSSIVHDYYSEERAKKIKFFSDVIQLCLLYMIIHPVLELLGMTVTMKITAKVHAGEKQATFKEVIYEKINLKGPSITYIYVHLLSSLNLLGIYWVVVNHFTFSGRFSYSGLLVFPGYSIWSIEFYMYILSVALHSAIFVALVYKYLGWSAFWNMTMVISVLEQEDGIGAFGMADYYGKRCRPTGFHLMLGFVAFSTLLRLPCIYAGLCSEKAAGILATSAVIGLVCLGYLVKWVAFVLYFQDCKKQTMEKKIDEELGKPVAAE